MCNACTYLYSGNEAKQKPKVMTIPQHIIKFNVSCTVFEVESEKHGLCSKIAREFMSYTYGNSYRDLEDVERYIYKFHPYYSEVKQNELAEAIVKTLFASHNVSPWG